MEEGEKGPKQGGEREMGNGARLVGKRHQELEGRRELVEEIHRGKVQILLVGPWASTGCLAWKTDYKR